jgi:hypothetical protein
MRQRRREVEHVNRRSQQLRQRHTQGRATPGGVSAELGRYWFSSDSSVMDGGLWSRGCSLVRTEVMSRSPARLLATRTRPTDSFRSRRRWEGGPPGTDRLVRVLSFRLRQWQWQWQWQHHDHPNVQASSRPVPSSAAGWLASSWSRSRWSQPPPKSAGFV